MHNQHVTIFRQPRDPEKFDVLDLFDAIGRDKKYVLGDKKDEAAFVDIISNALSVIKTPTMIYGRRVEVMFAYMVASLGKCALVKKEDCGDVFVGDGIIEIPDYKIVLNNGENMLVEVKNCYQKKPFNEFSMKLDYLDGLSRYADLMKTVLRIAIYWSKWCMWTLVAPDDFQRNGTKVTISLSTALKRNQMSFLGDVTIATIPPLAMRIYPDKQQPHNIIENNTAEFTISKVEMLCKNSPITVESEQRIALALMLFGNWVEDNKVLISPSAKTEIEYIEFFYSPQEYDHEQGFSVVGPLSTMISRQYGQFTAPNGKVRCLSADIAPGMLGFVIPEGYKGEALPLWRFHQIISDSCAI